MTYLGHYKRIPLLWSLLLMVMLPRLALAAESSAWELRKEEDGIRIWTRELADGKRELKINMQVPQSPEAVKALLLDFPAATRWRSSYLKSMKQIDHPNDHTWLVRVDSKPPWPFKATAAIIEGKIQQDAKSGTITYSYHERHDLMRQQGMETDEGSMSGEWVLTPRNGGTDITNIVQMQINIPVPGFVLNRLIDNETLSEKQRMREVLADPKYSRAATSH